MPRALLSVSDKSGLVPFATRLVDCGYELLSTGGTARALRASGLAVQDVSDLTGFPEILDGRVKTLHPAVHAALLARRDVPEHMEKIAEHGIQPIDLVVVNLYPFQQTAEKPGVEPSDVIENIDIGGPSMLRSAAKNFESVWTVVDPADYESVISAIEAKIEPDTGRDADIELRRRLAEKVYAHTSAYDASISLWFAQQRSEPFPDCYPLAFHKQQALRYGENPQQRAAFYVEKADTGLGALKQLGGKELSFNNLLDLEGALLAIEPFRDRPACAIIKHTTPCGIATGVDALDAYRKALACDPVSAFGSVIAFTVPVDATTADVVSSLFVECIVAPSFTTEAVELLVRKKNLRVLAGLASWDKGSMDFKRVRGGLLIQDRAPVPTDNLRWETVTKRAPTREEQRDLSFAWSAVASVKSNAIVLVRDGATIGIGAGQMSRVDASFLAVHKAKSAGHDTNGTSLGSDAFFPFRDGIDNAAIAGVRAIVQPGGSVRDEEVIAAADEHDIAMIFTGVRLFRH